MGSRKDRMIVRTPRSMSCSDIGVCSAVVMSIRSYFSCFGQLEKLVGMRRRPPSSMALADEAHAG